MTEKTTLEIIAPTVEEAISQGLAQLGLTADAVSVEVLDSGNKGLFGLGKPQVRVRLTVVPPAGTVVPPVGMAALEPEPIVEPKAKPKVEPKAEPKRKQSRSSLSRNRVARRSQKFSLSMIHCWITPRQLSPKCFICSSLRHRYRHIMVLLNAMVAATFMWISAARI